MFPLQVVSAASKQTLPPCFGGGFFHLKIYVDADACPVVDEVVDNSRDLPVVLVHNPHHELDVEAENVSHKMTGDRRDQADHYIYNHLEPGDLVVTDDLGLAALALSREADVIRFRGDRPDPDAVDLSLAMRHEASRQRRASRRVSGPSAFSPEDRQRFLKRFREWVEEST